MIEIVHKLLAGRKKIEFERNGVLAMKLSLKLIAAILTWLAVGFLFVAAAMVPTEADAQSASGKRAASAKRAVPPAKVRSQVVPRPASAASAWVPNPMVNAKDSYLILDASSGQEMYADRPDEPRHPASLTKLMTIYMTFSALDSGRLSLGDGLPVSINALNSPPTKVGLPPGGTIAVRDAIMALVTRSANDAAVALAETLAGDEASFAVQMTQKARQLGMSSTVFRNASGLPNSEQITTARDMARLAHALMRDYPHYYGIFSVQSYPFRGRTLENHNRMLGSYEGADGLKTGYTVASGFNLVMSAMRDNKRLIGVVMGGNTAGMRDRIMAELMDRGFNSGRLSTWTTSRKPPSARYTAANFDPNLIIPESTPKVAVARAAPATPAALPAAAVGQRVAGPAMPPPDSGSAQRNLAVGSWVIQVGSFGDAQSAQLALERASSALPDTMRTGFATVDEVQMANKTFHRARLTNLSQTQALDGCKRLEKRKIYCSAIQVTVWNTPGAR